MSPWLPYVLVIHRKRKCQNVIYSLPFHTIARAFSFTNGVFTPEQDNDKTNVEPVHSYDAFHTVVAGPGVKGIVGMHRFNICLVVLSLSCSGVKTPLLIKSNNNKKH